jgi:serine/threonine-protein kinase
VEAERDLLAPGSGVGDYTIEGEIGHGGMGVVYRAVHPVIGKQAAIKVLRRDMAKNRDTVERFIQEARSVNQIGHPNIVDIFAFGTLADGRPYLMMDLLVGESLRARLRRGPLHLSEAASVLDEVAFALAATHAKGIVHRDLKPDNVFLVERQGRWPEVKLLDFGLAKLIAADNAPVRTHTGIMLGTPDYMAPEQIRRRGTVDARIDIYALGVMAFESLTGQRPLPPGEGYDAMLARCEQPAPEINSIAPHLPRELGYLVDGMLLKEPEQRPTLADVRATLKRLRAVLPTQSVASLEIPVPRRTPVNASLGGITASRVGAEPMLPSLATAQLGVGGAMMPRTLPGTMPPVAPSGPLQLPPELFAATPTAAADDDDDDDEIMESTARRDEARAMREQVAAFEQARPPATRTSGLSNDPLLGTHLGVGVAPAPPRTLSAPHRALASAPMVVAAAPPMPVAPPAPLVTAARQGGAPWLWIGVILCVVAGVALALALTS